MMVSGDSADVTLVTDDKKELKAHQNILSSCSSTFFKEILNTHSVIYLSGIKHYTIHTINYGFHLS